MITVPTTLVLGAGASKPYGFPLGGKLRDEICEVLNDQDGYYFKLLQAIGFLPGHIKAFRDEFAGSMMNSIDLFLGRRAEFKEVGKAAIALKIARKERHVSTVNPGMEGDWYQYLWNRIAANHPWEDLPRNRLSIVTFNYDRSFEYFMHSVMQKTFGKNSEECAEMLARFEIVHVYGSLGKPTFWDSQGKKYSPDCTPEEIKKSC